MIVTVKVLQGGECSVEDCYTCDNARRWDTRISVHLRDGKICRQMSSCEVPIRQVRVKSGIDTHPVSDTDLVAVVKQQVAERLHVPAHQQRLLFKGKALADELSLCHYNIPPNAKLNLVVKAVGERTQHQATELVATVPATPTLWDLLSPLLSRHFSPTDAQVVLQQFQKDYERNLHGLSLDDVERLATQLLQPSQMQPLSCAMLE